MWTAFVEHPLFGISLTFSLYALAQALYRRTHHFLLFHPVLVTIVGLVGFLSLLRIPYKAYAAGGDMILFLLGPSVVALGVRVYTAWPLIMKKKLSLSLGIGSGALASIVCASGLAWLCGASQSVVLSLAPKSVTTPIAIGIAEKINGIPALTAALVVLTGCLVAICGPGFCRWIGVKAPEAMGLALGTAAHGIGTARMLEEHPTGGAIAGLAMGLNGLVTAFVVPLFFSLWHGLQSWF